RRMNGGCLADENEKAGLESVFGIMGVVQDALADPHDHRAVFAHQGLERGLVPLTEEAAQELGVLRTLLLDQGVAKTLNEPGMADGHYLAPTFPRGFPVLHWSEWVGLICFSR